jgi:CheY-like chemotaxis protein
MSAKILVVEDSFETRDSLTILLELSGYEVIVASDGDEGLAKALAEAPDLIVTDIRMPSVSGIEMLREFRRNLRHRVIPVLVVTGYSKDYANEAFEAGADHVISKPVNPDHLLRIVSNLLNISARARENKA